MQYNYDKLKGRIKEIFDTQENFANAINISSASVNYKLNNKKNFTQNEIFNSIKVLKLKEENIQEYFFTRKVEKNSININKEEEYKMEEMRKKVKEILFLLNGYSVSTAVDILKLAIDRLEVNSIVNVKKEEK